MSFTIENLPYIHGIVSLDLQYEELLNPKEVFFIDKKYYLLDQSTN